MVVAMPGASVRIREPGAVGMLPAGGGTWAAILLERVGGSRPAGVVAEEAAALVVREPCRAKWPAPVLEMLPPVIFRALETVSVPPPMVVLPPLMVRFW